MSGEQRRKCRFVALSSSPEQPGVVVHSLKYCRLVDEKFPRSVRR
jgi:hypothetical protein